VRTSNLTYEALVKVSDVNFALGLFFTGIRFESVEASERDESVEASERDETVEASERDESVFSTSEPVIDYIDCLASKKVRYNNVYIAGTVSTVELWKC
jgi:hypothetical protein